MSVTRLHQQILQSASAAGIMAIVHLEHVQCQPYTFNISGRRLFLRLLTFSGNLGNNERRQRADDGHHQQHFDQRKRVPSRGSIFRRIIAFHSLVFCLFDMVLHRVNRENHSDENRSNKARNEKPRISELEAGTRRS